MSADITQWYSSDITQWYSLVISTAAARARSFAIWNDPLLIFYHYCARIKIVLEEEDRSEVEV